MIVSSYLHLGEAAPEIPSYYMYANEVPEKHYENTPTQDGRVAELGLPF